MRNNSSLLGLLSALWTLSALCHCISLCYDPVLVL